MRHIYSAPSARQLNQRAPDGDWQVQGERAVLERTTHGEEAESHA
jgi:hypothetical protein